MKQNHLQRDDRIVMRGCVWLKPETEDRECDKLTTAQHPRPPPQHNKHKFIAKLRSSCGQQLTDYTDGYVARHGNGFATLMLVNTYLIYKKRNLDGQQTRNQTAVTWLDERMNPEAVINHSAPSSGQQRVGGDYSYLRFRLESGSPSLLFV